MQHTDSSRSVYIVDGSRTPFIKARGKPGPFSPVDLALWAGRGLLLRQPFAADSFDEVILGCVNPQQDEVNPGRVAALRLGCGDRMPGWTVQRNCGSGMQAVDTASRHIAHGYADLVLAGGTEALSRAPLIFRPELASWLGDWRRTGRFFERLRLLGRLRPHFFSPIIGLLEGLTDPVTHLNMGQTAEVLAHQWQIKRHAADRYALESHQRLAAAQQEGRLKEVEAMFDAEGRCFDHDDGVRPDTSLADLSSLKPVFEPPFGSVTAGNSSQVTDGACWLILASEAALERYDLTPMGRIVDSHWAALSPGVMGLGPVFAVTPMLIKQQLGCAEIDVWEINEAFAAQVLACLEAWRNEDFCRQYLKLDGAFGEIRHDRLNVDGGAISLGHPVGTSGARIILHALQVLKQRGKRRAVATECIGGGQGGAMLLEAVSG